MPRRSAPWSRPGLSVSRRVTDARRNRARRRFAEPLAKIAEHGVCVATLEELLPWSQSESVSAAERKRLGQALALADLQLFPATWTLNRTDRVLLVRADATTFGDVPIQVWRQLFDRGQASLMRDEIIAWFTPDNVYAARTRLSGIGLATRPLIDRTRTDRPLVLYWSDAPPPLSPAEMEEAEQERAAARELARQRRERAEAERARQSHLLAAQREALPEIPASLGLISSEAEQEAGRRWWEAKNALTEGGEQATRHRPDLLRVLRSASDELSGLDSRLARGVEGLDLQEYGRLRSVLENRDHHRSEGAGKPVGTVATADAVFRGRRSSSEMSASRGSHSPSVACERCGAYGSGRSITARGGERRFVCDDCADLASEGDRRFYRWYWHDAEDDSEAVDERLEDETPDLFETLERGGVWSDDPDWD